MTSVEQNQLATVEMQAELADAAKFDVRVVTAKLTDRAVSGNPSLSTSAGSNMPSSTASSRLAEMIGNGKQLDLSEEPYAFTSCNNKM